MSLTNIGSQSILKSFIIGSSIPVLLPFYYRVGTMDKSKMNYSYATYTIMAPIYLGLMSVISLLIGRYLGWGLRSRILLISIISPLVVMMFATIYKSYNFTDEEWMRYYGRIFIKHFLIYNILIYSLEKLT